MPGRLGVVGLGNAHSTYPATFATENFAVLRTLYLPGNTRALRNQVLRTASLPGILHANLTECFALPAYPATTWYTGTSLPP